MYRALDKWLAGYLASVFRRPRPAPGLKRLFFCVADHFEPFRGGILKADAVSFVRDWARQYERSVEGIHDADGRPPRHTFFYPAEDDDPDVLDILAGLCRDGHGEVEIHLHHRNDTTDGLRAKLEQFKNHLHERHGLLGTDSAGRVRYGFIHGNWALCNSRPDGDWCGVNEELSVLSQTGCYADFTFPSAPSPTQPRLVNAIYRAQDRPGRPRGADTGVRVECRVSNLNSQISRACCPNRDSSTSLGMTRADLSSSPGNCHAELTEASQRRRVFDVGNTPSNPDPDAPASLMIIPGPLGLDWRRRKWGLLPRIENAEISGANAPGAHRIRLWVRQWIHVAGRQDWVFVKVHTHGCVEANRGVILGTAMREAHDALHREFNDGQQWQLHYVTARELYNLARAAESGCHGPPHPYRDHEIGQPRC